VARCFPPQPEGGLSELLEFAEGVIGATSTAPSASAALSVSQDTAYKRKRDGDSDEDNKSEEVVSSLPSSGKDASKGLAVTPLRAAPPPPKKSRVEDFELGSS
jgi:hypothetical protein